MKLMFKFSLFPAADRYTGTICQSNFLCGCRANMHIVNDIALVRRTKVPLWKLRQNLLQGCPSGKFLINRVKRRKMAQYFYVVYFWHSENNGNSVSCKLKSVCRHLAHSSIHSCRYLRKGYWLWKISECNSIATNRIVHAFRHKNHKRRHLAQQ